MPDKQLANLFLEQSNDLFWIIDSSFCLVYANQAYQNVMKQVTGEEKKIDETIFIEGFGDGYIEKWKAYYERGLNGEHFEIEEHFYNPNTNQVEYSQIIFKPIADENDVVLNVACQSRDITSFIQSNTEAEILLDASLDVICSIDEQGIFIKVSDACKELWGYEKHELIGRAYIDFVIEEDIEKTNEAAAEILSGKNVTTFENRYKRKDGGIAFNIWSVRYDHKNKIMFCVARDAREKIRKEELLIESENRFKALVQEGADMISIIDAAGNYIYTSPTTTAILGISPEEFNGNSVFDFIHPDDIERSAGYMQLISTENKVIVEPFRLRDGNNEWRWIETVLTNMLDNPAVNGIVANSRDVTENINLIKSIEANEQFNKTIIESSPDCLKILDIEGRLIYMNFNGLCQMEIDDFSEFKNKQWWLLWGPENEALVRESVDKALTGETVQFTAACPTAKGTPKWWDVTVSPVIKVGEQVKQIISVSRDITKQKEEEQKLKAASAIAKIGYWRLDLEENTLSWTDEVYTIWDRKRESFELNYENFAKTIHPADLILFEKAQEVAIAGLAPLDHIHRIILPGNQIRWVYELGRLVKDGYGKAIGFEGTVQDITQQKEEEQRLKLLESVITNTHDAILITDAETFDEPGPRIIYVNEAFTKMTGYTPEEVIGKTPRILQGPDSNREDLREFGKKLRRWEAAEVTVLNYTKSGEPFWVNLSVSPVADQNGWFTHWVSIQRDVTEQKIKEREKELLTNISLNFNRENDYVNACKGFCQNIAGFGGFDLVELWTVNIERSKVKYTCHYLQEAANEVFYAETKDFDSFEKGSGLPGHVWQHKSQLLWNVLDDQKDFFRKKAAKEIGIKSVLGIPLLNQDEVIGVLLVGSKHGIEWLEKYSGLFTNFHNFIGSEIYRKKLENDLNHLYESIPDIVCVADFQGRFLKINRAGCHLLGYTEEELLYHNFDEFVFPADKDISAQEVAKLAKGQSTLSFENRYIQKSGEICWLSWTCNANMQEGIIYATARNITPEKKLRELNNVTSKMARIGSWEIDLQKNKLFWTEMVHQLHETDTQNFEPDLAKGINFYRKDFRPMVAESVTKCIQSGTPFDFEAVIVTANKNELWIRAIGNAEFVNGECIRIYGSFQDIHERKEANLRLQSLANNLPGVVFQYIIYPDGTDALKYVTKGANEIWEYSPEEVMANIDLVWNQTRAGGNFEEVQQNIKESVKTKNKWISRYKSVAPSGKIRTLLGTGTPDFLADGTVLYNSVVLDITKEAQNEELLKQASDMAKIGSWELDLINQENDAIYWSPMTRIILEVDEQYNPSLTGGFEFYTEDSKQRIQQAVDELIETGNEFDEELLIITTSKKEKWIRCIGKSERIQDKCLKIYGSFQDIHVSKSLEIQVREILESIGDAFFSVNKDWIVTYWNKEAELVLGKKREDIVGQHLWTEYADAVDTDFYRQYHEAMEMQENRTFEEYYPTLNKWVEVSVYPTPNSLSVYFKDVTLRKEADLRLVSVNQEKNRILERITEAFVSLDTNWCYTYMNKQAGEIFNTDTEKIIGKHIWTEFPQGLNQPFHLAYEKAMATQEYIYLEEHYEHYDLWFENHIYPSPDGISIFFRDVTERKKSEREIKQANERFEKATEATNDVIWDWDIENDTFFRSNAIDNFFGVGTSKVMDKKDFWKDNFHEEDISKIKASMEKALEDPDCNRWEEEYRILNNNNEIIFVIDRGLILRNKNGKAIRMVGAMTNITEQKKQEEKLIKLNQSLNEQATELKRSNEELEQFAFITSHDLQEPLRMISSFMDQLKRKYADRLDEKGLQYIHFATDGAKRMKQIILDLLLYSRANKPTEQNELINLNEIVYEYTQLRRKVIAEKKAAIIFDGLPSIETYRAPITQIFHCLLDNALKYVDENKLPSIEIDAIEKENVWQFAIKDNGIGIDQRFFDKIFIIFQRLQNRKEDDGTGIGLAIAKRSIEFLGGEIWVESELDKGSTFHFTIFKIK